MVWVQIRLGAFCSSCIKKFISCKRSFLYCNLDTGSCPPDVRWCPRQNDVQPGVNHVRGFLCPPASQGTESLNMITIKFKWTRHVRENPHVRQMPAGPIMSVDFFQAVQHLALISPLVTLRVYSDFPRHGCSFWWRPQFLCKFCGLQCAVQQGRAHRRFAAVRSSKYHGFCRPFVLLCDWWRFN